MQYFTRILFSGAMLCLASGIAAQGKVSVSVDAAGQKTKFSRLIFGKNLNGANTDNDDFTEANYKLLREAGINFARLNNGNNATKYNWRRKLTCHPDWYNNVYGCDWDATASAMQTDLPEIMCEYAFQLIGYAAKTQEYNFNDWEYNQSAWWEGCSWKLCGGGKVTNLDAANEDDKYIKGNTDLFLEPWTADSTVAILKHWTDDLGLDISKLRYWNMDNEAEMWSWTHKDLQPEFDADFYCNQYIEVAKKARAIYPDIKLTGPVAGSEWTWYNTSNPKESHPTYKGKKYPWLEYFIMRVGEAEKECGMKLLDVLDIHYYPDSRNGMAQVLQSHRTYFDTEYDNPEANGLYTINNGWDMNEKREYILGRCDEWMKKYIGENHGVTFAVSEYGFDGDASSQAVTYISHMGEMMKHNGEYFTPWGWRAGMWEGVHLMSRYSLDNLVPSKSTDINMVETYATISEDGDDLSLITVNRSTTETKTVSLSLNGFEAKNGECESRLLANLPEEETFVSHDENALVKESVKVENNTLEFTLPPVSVRQISLRSATASVSEAVADNDVAVFPTVNNGVFFVKSAEGVSSVKVFAVSGAEVYNADYSDFNQIREVSISQKGEYIVRVSSANVSHTAKVIVWK